MISNANYEIPTRLQKAINVDKADWRLAADNWRQLCFFSLIAIALAPLAPNGFVTKIIFLLISTINYIKRNLNKFIWIFRFIVRFDWSVSIAYRLLTMMIRCCASIVILRRVHGRWSAIYGGNTYIDIIARHVAGRARETQNLCKLREREREIHWGKNSSRTTFVHTLFYRLLCALRRYTAHCQFGFAQINCNTRFRIKISLLATFSVFKRYFVFSNEHSAYTSARLWRSRYSYAYSYTFCYYIYAFAVTFAASVHTLFLTLLTLNILFLLLLRLLLLICAIWTCAQLLYTRR